MFILIPVPIHPTLNLSFCTAYAHPWQSPVFHHVHKANLSSTLLDLLFRNVALSS